MRLLFICLALVVCVASAVMVPAEFRTHLRAQADPIRFFVTPDPELGVPQRSVEGVYSGLITCDETLSARATLFMPFDAVARVAEACRGLAEHILDRAPTLSLAHLIRAQSLLILGEVDPARRALVAAETTGGDITWMAERRFDLHARPEVPQDADTEGALIREAIRLAQSVDGRQSLAERFVARAEHRDLITSAVEGLPSAVQQQFLAVLQDEMGTAP